MSNSTRKFLMLWLLANTLSFIVPSVIMWSTSSSYAEMYGSLPIVPTIALLQWLVLRSFFGGFSWWIPATLCGSILGLLFVFLLVKIPNFIYLAFALTVGFMQSWVIKQRFVDSILWVLATIVGFCLGAFLSLLVFQLIDILKSLQIVEISEVVGIFTIRGITGITYAAVTGMCIIYLERRTIVKNRN